MIAIATIVGMNKFWSTPLYNFPRSWSFLYICSVAWFLTDWFPLNFFFVKGDRVALNYFNLFLISQNIYNVFYTCEATAPTDPAPWDSRRRHGRRRGNMRLFLEAIQRSQIGPEVSCTLGVGWYTPWDSLCTECTPNVGVYRGQALSLLAWRGVAPLLKFPSIPSVSSQDPLSFSCQVLRKKQFIFLINFIMLDFLRGKYCSSK
jgi:hypothetical protein